MECEYIPTCPFFNDKMAKAPNIVKGMKEKYCRADKTVCARYMVKTSGKPVPLDLFPHEVSRAKELLR
jgi:hypothetical protein